MTLDMHTPVGDLVVEKPARSRVFERHGIDYCCGGKRTLEEASRDSGLAPDVLLEELLAVEAGETYDDVDPAGMSMTELADHIEKTHHAFLRKELPRLEGLMDKVVAAHGAKFPWLGEVREAYAALVAELQPHMLKEEQILFPMIRQLDGDACAGHSVGGPIAVMEEEHQHAGDALDRVRRLTSGYVTPTNGCNTFRALMDGLATLEADLHQHIHEENNVLFVRATEAARA